MGINMPCKSVVFYGDSVYLTPLMFRQMSGRAGRRGFDDNGQVYFFGFSNPRIKQLFSSSLPQILGDFPLTMSFILQQLILYNSEKSNPQEYAMIKKTLQVFFELPLFSFGKEFGYQSQLSSYFKFTLDFLMRNKYLSSHCEPLEFSGLISHIHYTEPANFVLVHILKSEYLHEELEKIPNQKDKMMFILTFLSYLFNRIQLAPYQLKMIPLLHTPPSKIILPPPSDLLLKHLNDYNLKVFESFFIYIKSMCSQLDEQLEVKLPLSSLKFLNISPIMDDQIPDCFHTTITSPFISLSGQNDNFEFQAKQGVETQLDDISEITRFD